MGGQMALIQGLLAQLAAERAPEALRGATFGLFNLATGITMLAASVLARVLWDYAGPSATFIVGGGFAAIAALLILARRVVAIRVGTLRRICKSGVHSVRLRR